MNSLTLIQTVNKTVPALSNGEKTLVVQILATASKFASEGVQAHLRALTDGIVIPALYSSAITLKRARLRIYEAAEAVTEK